MGDAFGGAESGTQCGQTFVRVEGKLLAVSARNPVAPSMALMRQVPLEILLQNSEVNTSLIKTQLLARLEGRSSLKNLEPYLFAEEGSPVHVNLSCCRRSNRKTWEHSYPNPLQNCQELAAGSLTMELWAQIISRSSPVTQQAPSRGAS
ncbi:DNA repair protein XRCC2 isoform X4 [Corvus hawaiiensis]|uniref:DNA repair protein XRCC2 isoform X4 n=1 Tax=Corvus hawaiiensis TaxID=134902 RepID=UPI002018C4EC|nr:DNA repair protein XRCC2 isoform X4 [Corvus hawaiiensis]